MDVASELGTREKPLLEGIAAANPAVECAINANQGS
jgi:hypothetical protein